MFEILTRLMEWEVPIIHKRRCHICGTMKTTLVESYDADSNKWTLLTECRKDFSREVLITEDAFNRLRGIIDKHGGEDEGI